MEDIKTKLKYNIIIEINNIEVVNILILILILNINYNI